MCMLYAVFGTVMILLIKKSPPQFDGYGLFDIIPVIIYACSCFYSEK